MTLIDYYMNKKNTVAVYALGILSAFMVGIVASIFDLTDAWIVSFSLVIVVSSPITFGYLFAYIESITKSGGARFAREYTFAALIIIVYLTLGLLGSMGDETDMKEPPVKNQFVDKAPVTIVNFPKD